MSSWYVFQEIPLCCSKVTRCLVVLWWFAPGAAVIEDAEVDAGFEPQNSWAGWGESAAD